MLAERGVEVTQATVSRDLAAIGAIRGPQGYALPGEGALLSVTSETELESTLRRHVVRIEVADALVVIRTAPGHAGLLGAAIDRRSPKGVVGTIAGDDTLFLATPSRSVAAKVVAFLESAVESTEQAA